MTKLKLIALTTILLLIFLAVFGFITLSIANSANRAQSDWVGKEYQIEEGSSWATLGNKLKNEKLIRSLLWYKLQLRLKQRTTNQALTLKAGTYTWPKFMKTNEIIDFFQIAQPQKPRPITIPEGLTRREVALLLEEKQVLSAHSFLAESAKVEKYTKLFELPLPAHKIENMESLEGFLFPDTYFLPQNGYSAENMVKLMLQNFTEHLNKIEPKWRSLQNQDNQLYKKMILASIVQKEYRAKQEAPIIASVFQNRIDQGIKLESCATIVYILTEERDRPHPKRILFRDLEESSSYNTYLNKGLPPTPIASFGEVALHAVFNQAQTDYLFFVVKDAAKGTHTFSSSFANHNAAREAYINNYFG